MLLLQVELLLQVATNWSFAMNFWWISSMDISSKPTLVVNPRITFAWRRKGNQNIETSNLPLSPCQRPWAAGTWTSSGSCCSGSYLPKLTYIGCFLPVVQGHICLGDQHWELVFPPFCLSRAPPNVFHRTGVFQKVSPLPPSRFRKSCQNDRRHLANKAINFHHRYPDCLWNITKNL